MKSVPSQYPPPGGPASARGRRRIGRRGAASARTAVTRRSARSPRRSAEGIAPRHEDQTPAQAADLGASAVQFSVRVDDGQSQSAYLMRGSRPM